MTYVLDFVRSLVVAKAWHVLIGSWHDRASVLPEEEGREREREQREPDLAKNRESTSTLTLLKVAPTHACDS